MSSPRTALRHVGGRALRGARRRLRTPRERLVDTWHAADGDITYRLDFPLDKSSVVLDVGGYKGQFASDVYAAFRCRVHVYEPAAEFAAFVRNRFTGNPDIVVHDYGLAGRARTEHLSADDDASSVLAGSPAGEEIRLSSAVEELAAIGHVSLMKLNIEGLEFELLESLLDARAMTTVDHLLVQFHDFVPDATARRARIQSRLNATHELRWDFPFVWEAWRRRDAA